MDGDMTCSKIFSRDINTKLQCDSKTARLCGRVLCCRSRLGGNTDVDYDITGHTSPSLPSPSRHGLEMRADDYFITWPGSVDQL